MDNDICAEELLMNWLHSSAGRFTVDEVKKDFPNYAEDGSETDDAVEIVLSEFQYHMEKSKIQPLSVSEEAEITAAIRNWFL